MTVEICWAPRSVKKSHVWLFGSRNVGGISGSLGFFGRSSRPSSCGLFIKPVQKPIGSMYGMYANIKGGILMGSMLPYMAYMDPMGLKRSEK